MTKLIANVGFIGSGKDTVADYLSYFHHFERESFASPLKDAISVIFGWDRELLEGRTSDAREWRETIDNWWANRLGVPHLTPRWVLQYWGTEVCRHGFHDDIWIASLEKRIYNTDKPIVITDCRFPNELTAVKKAGGISVRVVRGEEPEWYHDAILANQGDMVAKTKMKHRDIHTSEWSLLGYDFDVIVENNSTIEHLYETIDKIVSSM